MKTDGMIDRNEKTVYSTVYSNVVYPADNEDAF